MKAPQKGAFLFAFLENFFILDNIHPAIGHDSS
jgi:hypothetical protein